MPGRRADPGFMADLEQLLRERHAGSARGAKGDALLAELADRWPGQHHRRVNEAVAELRRKGVPIGSTSARGYFLIQTEGERGAFRAEQSRRIRAAAEALRAVDAAGASRVQLALEGI